MTTSLRISGAFILLALALLAPFSTADAQTFGKGTIGALTSNGLSADFKRGSKFTLTQDGWVQDLCAYLDGNGGVSGQQQIRFVLYKDAAGVPGAKVAESRLMTYSNGAAPHWYCDEVDNYPVTAGNYWLAIHSSGTAGVVRDYYDNAANWYGNADSFADGPSSSFGTASAGNGTLSMYAYYVTSPPSNHGGRSTTGATPSNGLSADYKRASAFTLTQAGRLDTMSVYLDGNGGTAGSQNLRMALYRDANGLPGAKVTESPLITVPSGQAAHWDKQFVTPYMLSAGRYWIALHSGGTPGIIRDYGGDGGNNFYANADLFSDGAASSFGTGSAGTGTLSAYISYNAGAFQTLKVGNEQVGVPSAGLTSNRQRGSSFYASEPDAVITALYAYLDGNGGASGSQQLRMAIYNTSYNGQPYGLKVLSDTVTINAGTPPGWVRFPVAPTRLDQSYYGFIMSIHSGLTGGVVRDYGGTTGNNWVGWADNFADGTGPGADGWSFGTGTLSMYAEYSTSH